MANLKSQMATSRLKPGDRVIWHDGDRSGEGIVDSKWGKGNWWIKIGNRRLRFERRELRRLIGT